MAQDTAPNVPAAAVHGSVDAHLAAPANVQAQAANGGTNGKQLLTCILNTTERQYFI